ncbi:MAG: hypothetical protein HDS25_01135 [Bacteroides sp.]|nr:hypothetical protein [Bacteroides sp.]MBD5294910.1 hypothetical protein [Bacteroides sp.]
MKFIKSHISRLFNHSLLVGIVSIICPSVIHVKPLEYHSVDDAEALASDWKEVGSYIQNSYDAIRKK